MSTEAYDALISGHIDGYTNDSYHLTRRKSEPLSQSPVLHPSLFRLVRPRPQLSRY